MATKILFCTDFHFRAMRPIARIDEDFIEAQMKKLEHLAEVAKEADITVFGGDIFDRPDIPPSVVIRVMRMLTKFPSAPYTVIGNHDVYGYEGKSVDASAIGILLEQGSLKRLDYLELSQAVLYGIHAFDKAHWRVDASDKKKIIVAHKMITSNPIPNVDCILVNDVARVTNADVVLSGDIHHPHEVEVNNKLFVNPGSITRLSIIDRTRLPQAAMITITDDGDVEHEMVPVSSIPGDRVFNIKDYSAKVAAESHTKDFVKTYASVVISVKAEAHKIGDILARFIRENNITDEMGTMIKAYYVNAEKQTLKEVKER